MFLFLLVGLVSITVGVNSIFIEVHGQSSNNITSNNTANTDGGGFIVVIRGITSMTEEKMVALISTPSDVQAEIVDLDKAVFESGQEEAAIFPKKMIDVPIKLDNPVKPDTEVMACVLQLGSTDFSQSVKCNTVFSESGSTGEPQKIIVPL